MRCSALVLVALMASVTWASDRPSQQVLSDMGLSGLTVLSDSEGLAVRGFGYSPVSASGYGWATVKFKGGSAGSINKYSSTGKRKAWGENESKAGVIVVSGGGHGGNNSCGGNCGGHGGGNIKAVIAFSGGSSSAGRK
jgi:hypothetical protein